VVSVVKMIQSMSFSTRIGYRLVNGLRLRILQRRLQRFVKRRVRVCNMAASRHVKHVGLHQLLRIQYSFLIFVL